MGVKVILTGATGMVGEGVLHECLQHRDIEKVLIINRRPSGVTHPKLQEIILANFFDLSSIENELLGYDACFFCLGVSSLRMKESKYYHLTFSLTLNFARTLLSINPDSVFCYVSGVGTDSSEVGRSMWARIRVNGESLILWAFAMLTCFDRVLISYARHEEYVKSIPLRQLDVSNPGRFFQNMFVTPGAWTRDDKFYTKSYESPYWR